MRSELRTPTILCGDHPWIRGSTFANIAVRKFWGRGLATEAARACRDYGFDDLGYARLISLIDPANGASRRVAEKVGMSLERLTQKWDKTVCVYSISDRETPKPSSRACSAAGPYRHVENNSATHLSSCCSRVSRSLRQRSRRSLVPASAPLSLGS